MQKPITFSESAQNFESEKVKKILYKKNFEFCQFSRSWSSLSQILKNRICLVNKKLVFFAGITFQAESIDNIFSAKNLFQSQK